ncbi:TPA: hypothetical protein ACIAIG_002738, partial [Enterobacter asburiae]
ARENMPDGGFALSGLQNSQARQADPTAKRNKNTKKGCINAEKQKPSHRLGSLNSGARTRNRTKDTGIFNPFKRA